MIDFIKAISNNLKQNVNLSIELNSFQKSSDDMRPTLLQLFQECGPHIDYLKLDCGYVWWEEITSDLLENKWIPFSGIGNELFPNMKELEILDSKILFKGNDSKKCFKDRKRAFIAFVKGLFRNSPNLREITLNGDDEDSQSLFKIIGESGLPIGTLELRGLAGITESEMSYLQPLNLKKLVIRTSVDLEDLQEWTEFLESQSATLKYLRLETESDLAQFTFPRMESLETFQLSVENFAKDDESDEELEPISYQNQLNQMPKLKKLEVGQVGDMELPFLFPSDAVPTRSVKELRLHDILPALQKDILTRSNRLFESLSKLEIPVASYLSDLWKDLSGLEELTLHPKMIAVDMDGSELCREKITWIDGIITGLPLTDSDCEWNKFIQRREEEYEKMETKKSLALLTRLKLFRIRNWDWDCDSRPNLLLGDICCKVVLIKMESLKCIEFCGNHPSSVGASRKVFDEMGKKMDLFFGKNRERN